MLGEVIGSLSRDPRIRRNPASSGEGVQCGAPGRAAAPTQEAPASPSTLPGQGSLGRAGVCLPLALPGPWVVALLSRGNISLPSHCQQSPPSPADASIPRHLHRESGYLPPPSATGGDGGAQASVPQGTAQGLHHTGPASQGSRIWAPSLPQLCPCRPLKTTGRDEGCPPIQVLILS